MAVWQSTPIEEIAEVVGGGTPKTKVREYWNGEIPWLTPKDLANHKERYISAGARCITELGLRQSSARLLPPGTVLLSSRAPVGYTAIAENPITTNQGFRSLVLHDGHSPEFFFYLLGYHRETLESHASGTTFKELSGSALKQIHFPLPSPREQRAIARVLGAFDDKIELNRRMAKTLEEIAAAIFKSWFVDFDGVEEFEESELGRIPKGWSVRPLKDLVSVTKGCSYRSRELEPSSTALVTLKSVQRGGGFKTEGLKEYVGEFKPAQIVEPGEIVIACTDLTQAADVLAKPALVRKVDPYDCLVASLDLAVVRPKKHKVNVPFLYYLFRAPDFQDHAYGYANGSTVLHLGKEAIPEYRLALPETHQLERFEKVAAPLLELSCLYVQEIQTLSKLRDTLLPKLISGKVRVPVKPEDSEPLTVEAT